MKKNYISLFAIAIGLVSITPLSSSAQYHEAFDGITKFSQVTLGTGTSAVTYNIGDMPTTWKQVNVDSSTVVTSLEPLFKKKGWISLKSTTDTVVISTSKYTPVGQAEKYLISPKLTMPTTGQSFLTWEAFGSTAKESYEIRISTMGDTVKNFAGTPFYTVASEKSSSWNKHAIDISSFNGQSVNIAIVNITNDGGVLYFDDLKIESISNTDAELVSISANRFTATNSNDSIRGVVKNNGLPITKLAITWTDGSGINSDTLKGLNIAPYDTYKFTHKVAFNKANVDEFAINIAITNVNNGATESNILNNLKSLKISTIADLPKKRVLLEEGTGTWCGWCPRGAVGLNAVSEDPSFNDDFVGIAVHNNDPMMNSAYNTGVGFKSFPGLLVDRKYLLQDASLTYMQFSINDVKNMPSPVSIVANSSLNKISKELTVKVSSTFKTKLTEDARFAVVLVEDSVHSTVTGYEQSNYYSKSKYPQNTLSLPEYDNLTSPVPAADMYYNHVGRELIGGFKGLVGSVPTTIVNGTTAEHTFTYTVPAKYNLKYLKVVGLIVNGVSGEVYNAFGLNADGSFNGISEVKAQDINMNVYPNPVTANNNFKVSFNLKETKTVSVNVYSESGEVVYSNQSQKVAGNQMIEISSTNWATGAYVVNVSYDNVSVAKNITVIK